MIKEEEAHRRLTRQYFSNIVEDLRKNFRFFAKPTREQYPDCFVATPMDLNIIEDNIQDDQYELPKEFLEDVARIVNNAELYNDPNIVNQKEVVIKVSVYLHSDG